MGKKSAEKMREEIGNIKEDYDRLEKKIVNELFFGITHGAITGHYREKIWGKMFKKIIPRKFVIEQSVCIIDSEGNVSNEVDLAIFDEMYTPYVFRHETLKFIPIEAVVAVIECKSKSMKLEKLKDWAESIERLQTSNKSVVRMAHKVICGSQNPVITQTATRPLRILCCLNKDYEKGMTKAESCFDIVIRAEENLALTIQWDKTKETLYDWYETLNHVKKEGSEESKKENGDEKEQKKELEKDNKEQEKEPIKIQKLEDYTVHHQGKQLSLMTFNFQFNQVLMLVNNPMLFPHIAYAEMFNKEENADNE